MADIVSDVMPLSSDQFLLSPELIPQHREAIVQKQQAVKI